MWWYDPDAAARDRECRYVRQFRQIATDSILAHLTEAATPEQYQLALDALLALKDELSGRSDAFHRSVLYGRHRCIEDAYLSLRLKLQGAMVLKSVPQPAPEPPPAPREPLTTPAQVVEDLQETITPRPDETVIGADEPDDGSTG
jgi:hypothetical protein